MATPHRLTPVQALAAAIMGERRWTIADANAEGYYSVQQLAEAAGCDQSCIASRLKRSGHKYDRIRLATCGVGYAYRLKTK